MQLIRPVSLSLMILAMLWLPARAVQAEEVTLQHNGVTLSADLQLAAGQTPAGETVLITHGGLAHREMELIVYLGDLLRERGYNTLAINLGLGIDRRQGMYDCAITHRHKYTDAADEIGLWVNWLAAQGVQRVVALGHSRGAAQTALYALEQVHPTVKAAVLLAPPTAFNAGAGYQQRYGEPLQAVLHHARALVADNRGGTVMQNVNLLYCRDTAASAESFLSYYQSDFRLDSPSVIARLRIPTLVLIAGEDQVVVDLPERLAKADNTRYVKTAVIDGADHFFRDLNADDAVDEIHSYLESLPR